MTHRIFKSLPLLCLTSIAACGGGGSSTGNSSESTPTFSKTPEMEIDDKIHPIVVFGGNYSAGYTGRISTNVPIAGQWLEATTGEGALGGVSLLQNGSTGTIDMSSLAGLMVFDTGAVTLSNSQVTLVDKDGFNAAGILSDGSISIANMSTNGTYDYAILIDQSYSINGVTYDATGILGLISDPAEMPTSLKTRYSGEAHAIIVQGSQGFDLTNGKSTLDVDFGTKRVNVSMSDFTATDMFSQKVTTAPIDTITGTDLVINGYGFSGGTYQTLSNGRVTDVTGQNTVTTGKGVFFGQDETLNAPDEIGGMVFIKGKDGIVSGWYIAD